MKRERFYTYKYSCIETLTKCCVRIYRALHGSSSAHSLRIHVMASNQSGHHVHGMQQLSCRAWWQRAMFYLFMRAIYLETKPVLFVGFIKRWWSYFKRPHTTHEDVFFPTTLLSVVVVFGVCTNTYKQKRFGIEKKFQIDSPLNVNFLCCWNLPNKKTSLAVSYSYL